MERTNIGILSVGLLGALGAHAARAQSFNVDLDVSFISWANPLALGAPSPAFPGAAGQVGFWNAAPSHVTTPIPLASLANTATSATLTMATNAPNGFAHWSAGNTSNTGDWAKLLNDAHIVNNNPGPWSNTYTFNGLTPGTYQVFTYGVRPMTGLSATRVTLTGGSGPATIVGPMPGNSFGLGITHAVDSVTITGSTLLVTIDRNSTLTPDGAYANGFQLVYSVPAPGAASVLGLGGIAAIRRRRR